MRVIKSTEEISDDGVLVVIDEKVQSQKDLFKLLSASLLFPAYFGNNWDAVVDLISDLTWLEGKPVSIFVTTIRGLEKEDIKCLVEILAMVDKDTPSQERKPVSPVSVYFTPQVIEDLNAINRKWVYKPIDSGL